MHASVYAPREALNVVFRSQPCHFKKKISLSSIMFNSLKLEQMIDFVLKVRLKLRAQKERHKRERERERERGDNSLYPVLHLSL